jgi:hypothetical protein
VSAFLAIVDHAALHGPEGGFVRALAHEALPTLERDRPVRCR